MAKKLLVKLREEKVKKKLIYQNNCLEASQIEVCFFTFGIEPKSKIRTDFKSAAFS